MFKKVLAANDHAGFNLKEHFKSSKWGELITDLGPFDESRVDYPDYANLVCRALKTSEMGLLICGSGQGMNMRANKFSHIRAALCWSPESAKLAREHNDANVLCLGARLLDEKLCMDIFETFFGSSFEGGRHQLRVNKIGEKS